MRTAFCCAAALSGVPIAHAVAQGVPLTRAAAIASALAHGPQLAVSATDTLIAAAQLLGAGALPDPTLSAIYSKDVPRYHVTAEFPLDFIALRGTRVRSAEAARTAAQYRFAFDRASVELGADTTYTRALAAQAQVRLSQRNAVAADSLRQIAVARRDAGDASDLDVELATVSAGQATNAAAADSLGLAATLLDLQALVGIPSEAVSVTLVDSLVVPTGGSGESLAGGATLPVASASAALESAVLAARVQHRSVFGMPALMFGFDAGDPSGGEPGVLPTVGLAFPLPLFNRNRGPIAEAEAVRQRAAAELDVARVASRTGIAQAQRARDGALARVRRDAVLVASADRVAAMSLTAYREGAVPLATALEAQRSARDILSRYVDDVAAAAIAAATLRVLTLTPGSVTTP